ncbi:MAG: cytochrome c oxidase subunit II [Candidatus Hydrogenedentes bacterium]|nr:cytochrome c oxidase subunit II [Candidatus Hydrogenedentota bacterium]
MNLRMFIPEQASTYAVKVDPLFYALTAFTIVFVVGLTFLLIYLGLKYIQKPGSGRRSVHVENMALELTWSAIPAVIALGIFVWGAVLYYDYRNIPANTLDINVIGKQWMWKIQHPNGLREVNELTVPKGQPVKLTMTSQDVLHSFYIPAFRVKQDVLPARYTTMWFEATKVGTFPLFCAEYCGTEHSTMGGLVHVVEPAEYQQWLAGGPSLTPVQAGEALFASMGCATCHAAGDASRGPHLEGKFGAEETLRDGTVLTVDEEYVRESIMNPTAKVVKGYTPLMPNFTSQLNDEDVSNLVAYIKSLSAVN